MVSASHSVPSLVEDPLFSAVRSLTDPTEDIREEHWLGAFAASLETEFRLTMHHRFLSRLIGVHLDSSRILVKAQHFQESPPLHILPHDHLQVFLLSFFHLFHLLPFKTGERGPAVGGTAPLALRQASVRGRGINLIPVLCLFHAKGNFEGLRKFLKLS